MLHETIEIDCDKEQLEAFNDFFEGACDNGRMLYIKTTVRDGRLQLLGVFNADANDIPSQAY